MYKTTLIVFCDNIIQLNVPFHVAVQIVGSSYQGIIMQVNIINVGLSFQLNVSYESIKPPLSFQVQDLHYMYVMPPLTVLY